MQKKKNKHPTFQLEDEVDHISFQFHRLLTSIVAVLLRRGIVAVLTAIRSKERPPHTHTFKPTPQTLKSPYQKKMRDRNHFSTISEFAKKTFACSWYRSCSIGLFCCGAGWGVSLIFGAGCISSIISGRSISVTCWGRNGGDEKDGGFAVAV